MSLNMIIFKDFRYFKSLSLLIILVVTSLPVSAMVQNTKLGELRSSCLEAVGGYVSGDDRLPSSALRQRRNHLGSTSASESGPTLADGARCCLEVACCGCLALTSLVIWGNLQHQNYKQD